MKKKILIAEVIFDDLSKVTDQDLKESAQILLSDEDLGVGIGSVRILEVEGPAFFRVGLADIRGLWRQAGCENLEEVKNWLLEQDHEGSSGPQVLHCLVVKPSGYGYEDE